MDDLLLVGRVARAHGNRGQVIVNLETDFPEERFKVGRSAAGGTGGTKRARSPRSGFTRAGRSSRCDGVETMNDAEALAGAESESAGIDSAHAAGRHVLSARSGGLRSAGYGRAALSGG